MRQIIVVAIVMVISPVLFGWTPTNFVYFTNIERQRDGSRVTVVGNEGIVGRVRSNDTLLFQSGAHYTSTYYSAQDTFLLTGDGEPNFQVEPRLSRDSLRLGNAMSVRQNANPYILDGNGRLMTWIKLKGDAGIDIFQYPLGSVRQESLYTAFGVPGWQTIFVDGQCEVEGTLSGGLTIASRGNMWLLDDVRYTSANPRTGNFNEDDRSIGMLTLISEQNIIIKNSPRNGRGNGYGVPGDYDRHSIVITAAVIVPNGSFTFEHQNNDWEPYQGPDPDERGYVFLKGCLIQNRRGLLHTANHNGTGYGLRLSYDNRFEIEPPFGFDEEEVYWIEGESNRMELDTIHNYIVGSAVTNELTILPEHKIYFHSRSRLEVRRSLNLLGRENAPVHLRVITDQQDAGELIFSGRGRNSVRIVNADFDPGLNVRLDSDSISIRSAEIYGSLEVSGNFEIINSKVMGRLLLDRPGRGNVTRSLLFAGLEVDNWGWDLEIINNTISGMASDGVRLESGFQTKITNNIIINSRNGIVCDGVEPPQVGYNLLYDIQRQAYFGCEPGEGALNVDPLFVDPRRQDYRLTENSPCIDAGDPDSPLDPDGTRADVGAFWFDQGLAVGDPPVSSPPASRGEKELTASPNPFNATTVIRFTVGAQGLAPLQLAIYDLSGRKVFAAVSPPRLTVTEGAADRGGSAADSQSFTWDASAFPAGIYIVRCENGTETVSLKLLKVN